VSQRSFWPSSGRPKSGAEGESKVGTDSRESWERFRDEVLTPGLATVEGGFAGPPEETTFEVGKLQESS
jgi:hypothetical protein